MALPLRRSAAEDLSAAFARAIRAGSRPEPPLVGVEHEFRVLDGARSIDFRQLIHHLPIPGRRLDPDDPNAYRGAWGGSITSDGREAELAIPPQAIGAGFASRAAAAATCGRGELERALPEGLRLEGYSTHISVSMGSGLVERAARQFAERFGPALMMLMDGPESPGLLVRPRPGRLELGAEFVDGERLRAAVTFAAGAAMATARTVGSRIPWAGHLPGAHRLPPAIEVEVEPALDRFGWLVSGVVGADLHGEGRRARLRLRQGGRTRRTMTGQQHLERAWATARHALRGLADAADLELVDRIVAGAAPLGVELDQPTAIAWGANGRALDAAETLQTPAGSSPAGSSPASAGPFGSVVGTRKRPGLLIEPALVGWDFAVLRITEDLATVTGRTAFACLPRAVLGPGLEAIDRGHLDAILRAYLNLKADPRILAGAPQTRRPGLYRAVAAGGKLLAREFGPDTPGGDRPGKRDRPRDSQDPPTDPPPSGPTSLPAGAVPAAAAAAAAATIFGLPAAAAAAVVGVATVAVIGGAIVIGGFLPPGATPSGSAGATASAGPDGSPTEGPIALDCATYLLPDEIREVTGLESSTGQVGDAITPGEEVCEYGVGGGSLFLSIFRDPDPRSFYDGTVASFVDPSEAFGVGDEATYSAAGPSFPVFDGDDAIAVIADGVTFTLWMRPGPALGQPAHVALAILILDRLGTGPPPGPGPTAGPGGASLTFGSGEASMTAVVGAESGSITVPLTAGQIDEEGFLTIFWSNGVPDPATGGTKDISQLVGLDGTVAGDGFAPIFPESPADFIVELSNGEQVHSTTASDLACDVTVERTVTGGIEGGMSCTGVDQEYGPFSSSGTFWAEPGAVGPGPDPEPVAYTTGEASLTFGGEASGGAELAFDSEAGSGDGDGTVIYPSLTFFSQDASNYLEIVMPTRRPSGTFNTFTNEVGLYWGIEDVDTGFGPETYPNGLGLVHGSDPDPEVYCVITFTPTSTGGVTGTIECPNTNHPSLVYTLDGTFWAEPGGGVIVSP